MKRHRCAARAATIGLLPLLLLFTSAACGSSQEAVSDADAELREAVDRLVPRLEQLSGLEQRTEIRMERQDREAMREYVLNRLENQLPPEEMDGLERSYTAFGLLPDTVDLEPLLVDLYTEQVAGYYDPEAETLYVLEDIPEELLESVLAHELVHALQDQHADLEDLMESEFGNDRETAVQAAIEGHATLVMFALMAEDMTGGALDVTALPDIGAQLRPALEGQNAAMPVFGSAPRILRETMLFPYLSGAGFVQQLWRRAGRYAAPLDTLLPQSTEQVLYPAERFFDNRDVPTDLTFAASTDNTASTSTTANAAIAASTDSAWRTLYENTLGALEVGILLGEHLGSDAESLARGWDGDRFRLLEDADGRTALVWYTVWDDAASADAFADAYRRILDGRPDRAGRVERREHEGRPVVYILDAEEAIEIERIPDLGLGGVSESSS